MRVRSRPARAGSASAATPPACWDGVVDSAPLQPLAEDWERALAIVAHPDDMESGAASAVARWTAAGKWVGYVLATRGEAGIASLPPEQAAPVRDAEQRRACDIVGVQSLEYLGHSDGLVVG